MLAVSFKCADPALIRKSNRSTRWITLSTLSRSIVEISFYSSHRARSVTLVVWKSVTQPVRGQLIPLPAPPSPSLTPPALAMKAGPPLLLPPTSFLSISSPEVSSSESSMSDVSEVGAVHLQVQMQLVSTNSASAAAIMTYSFSSRSLPAFRSASVKLRSPMNLSICSCLSASRFASLSAISLSSSGL